jgi:hypothetical protein
VPIILQYNKQDLDNLASEEELDELLRIQEWARFLSSALHGDGVFETLKAITQRVVFSLQRQLDGDEASRPKPAWSVAARPALEPEPPLATKEEVEEKQPEPESEEQTAAQEEPPPPAAVEEEIREEEAQEDEGPEDEPQAVDREEIDEPPPLDKPEDEPQAIDREETDEPLPLDKPEDEPQAVDLEETDEPLPLGEPEAAPPLSSPEPAPPLEEIAEPEAELGEAAVAEETPVDASGEEAPAADEDLSGEEEDGAPAETPDNTLTVEEEVVLRLSPEERRKVNQLNLSLRLADGVGHFLGPSRTLSLSVEDREDRHQLELRLLIDLQEQD